VQPAFLVISVFAIAASLAGQPALSTREVTGARTCLGPAEVRASPVKANQDIVIAVIAGTLSADDLAQLQKEAASLYQSGRNQAALRIAGISAGAVEFAGPFKTRAQLQARLGDMARAAPENAGAGNAAQFYSNLSSALSQLGGRWNTLLLAGRFPAVEKELAPYVSAWVATAMRTARVQVSYWTPGEPSEVLDRAAPATGGSRLDGGLAALAKPSPRWEVTWSNPALPAAFRVCPITLVDDDGRTVAIVPSIAAAAGFAAPDLERYAVLREKIKSLAQAATQAEPSALAEADLRAALEINPRDEEALRLGAEIYRRSKNDARLAPVLAALTGIAPAEPALFAELGHCLFRLRDWDGADRALLRARELQPGDPGVAEELARIRLDRVDDRASLAFLEERLSLAAGTQELWLLRADAANRLGDWQRSADSTERALALGSVPLARRTALIRLYLEHQAAGQALTHVRAVAGSLPPDAAVRAEYACFLDDLKQPKEALAAWKSALEVNPQLEAAHYRITRLLMIDGSAPGEALDAAESGVRAAPQSARLYLTKAELLEKLDRFYQARQTLRDAAAAVPDPSLVARLAEMEDAGGEHAARYYRTLAEAGNKSLLDRGLEAAQRDGDFENIAWFQAQLGAGKAAAPPRVRTGTATIPGGLEALSLVAHSRSSSPDRFLVEFARTAVTFLDIRDKKVAELYSGIIREHFRRVGDLAALGTVAGGSATVTITARDKAGQKNAEKVLDLLGWKMHASKLGVKLDPAEKGARAAHQETATALAIDEIGMQQALESGKPFSFSIPMDAAGVVLGEEPWRTQFYPKEHLPGGLAEAIAGNLELAQTYAALGQMDPGTSTALVSGIGLKVLAEKYAGLLYQYSSAMAIEHGRAAVPGGAPAETAWTRLVGASPAQPGPFFRALLARDDGKLLAYFAALGELDIGHQRLFTRTADRTARFYDLFKESPEIQLSSARHLRSGSFVEFLSEVPLDDDGNVNFPGSPEVWMVAKGQSHSVEHTARMLKKLKRVVAPDVEDEILLRLARTHYKQSAQSRSELENFVAVVRIDGHRSDPLDEASALLLAQHFSEDGAVYPYFAILTGLGQKQFEQFFQLVEILRHMPPAERAAQLAPIDSLIEIVCLARQAGTIDEPRSTELFGRIVERFQKVSTPAARTAASLELVRQILASGKDPAGDPDAGMQSLLLGLPDEAASGQGRVARFRQVLELQKVPALATLLALTEALENLATGKGSAAAGIKVLESQAAGLLVVDVPKELGLKGRERDLVEAFQPRRLPEIVKQFREKTARKNVKLPDLEKLATEYLQAIDAPTRWALAGIVYACFLRPDDLLVSEDPLLLRKHQFALLDEPSNLVRVFEPSQLYQSSQSAGSSFQGGFANFADTAGLAAAVSGKLGGESGQTVAGKQISAIRSTNWEQLRDGDLRLFGLKIAVAREWVARAAGRPELAASLGEAAFGLLSLTRRAELLGALADGDWRAVWNVLTLSDLYFLGDRYLERYPADAWVSAATQALRRELARNDGSRLAMLGADFAFTFGCSHPHLRGARPYEAYEKDMLIFKLAERSAEFKLYLARYADAAGQGASSLGVVAETAARTILKRLQMTDGHDWRSVLAGFSEFDGKMWEEALTAR
jgi:tetratricopeptide (TPR) repeat protein